MQAELHMCVSVDTHKHTHSHACPQQLINKSTARGIYHHSIIHFDYLEEMIEY